MSQELTENGSHPTPEEIHRLKQRNQYQLMLAGLDQLSEVLPPTVGADKVKSKQILLSEAAHYIHYLHLCIYQLGKDTETSEYEIGRSLNWDTHCDDSCECLLALKKISSGCSSLSPAKYQVPHSDVSDDNGPEKHRVKIVRRSSTPTPTSGNSSARMSSHWRRNVIRKNANGPKRSHGWRISPIKSPAGWPWHRTKAGKGGEVLGKRSVPIFQSPPGTHCDIISPPHSYKRTIIEDSPQDLSNLQNWENVSVRKSKIPWMPKPDNKYGSVENLAEKIVTAHSRQVSDPDLFGDDMDGHVLSRSHPLDSFLDSSFTEDEYAPFTDFETSGLGRPRPNLDDSEPIDDHSPRRGERIESAPVGIMHLKQFPKPRLGKFSRLEKIKQRAQMCLCFSRQG